MIWKQHLQRAASRSKGYAEPWEFCEKIHREGLGLGGEA